MRITAKYVFMALALAGVYGCSNTSSSRVLQNKFVFPNSDLTPLSTVHAEKSETSFLTAPPMDKAELDELTREALQQKGGDTLIDYVVSSEVTFIPPIPVYLTTVSLDGTAVRVVEIGRQQLH